MSPIPFLPTNHFEWTRISLCIFTDVYAYMFSKTVSEKKSVYMRITQLTSVSQNDYCIYVKSPSLGGRLPLFDPISLLNIHLPPRRGNLPLFESHFLPIIFSLKGVNCIEFCKENALLSHQSIHKVQ